jgi:hypothetical protein
MRKSCRPRISFIPPGETDSRERTIRETHGRPFLLRANSRKGEKKMSGCRRPRKGEERALQAQRGRRSQARAHHRPKIHVGTDLRRRLTE